MKSNNQAQSEAPSVEKILQDFRRVVWNSSWNRPPYEAMAEAEAKINRLLMEARKKEAEYWDYNILPAHRSEQLAKDASKRIAELNNQLNEGGEK